MSISSGRQFSLSNSFLQSHLQPYRVVGGRLLVKNPRFNVPLIGNCSSTFVYFRSLSLYKDPNAPHTKGQNESITKEV